MPSDLKFLFHVKHGPEQRAALVEMGDFAGSIGVELDATAGERLLAFEEILADRAVRLGLIARSDRGRIRRRHVMDCLRAVVAVRPGDDLAYDLGSGAGLPGIVVAIARPTLSVALVEPRNTRVAFLELAVERLELRNASVVPGRIQDVTETADLCFARAFAPLDVAWGAALPRLRPGGRLVYFAGAGSKRAEALLRARSVEVVETPVLESAGPLIIMGR
ncbi:MAG: 16S rRNA (guanine(527)-N(7))-methyltransferase RsmG [Actinomycetota bacterium]